MWTWHTLKFLIKSNRKLLELYRELKNMYGDARMKKFACLWRHFKLQKGWEGCESESSPGMPVTGLSEEAINTAGLLITTNLHLTTRQLIQILYILLSSVYMILHNYWTISHMCEYWIPHLLTHEQKQWCVKVCEYQSECVYPEGDEWWKAFIMSDKSLV